MKISAALCTYNGQKFLPEQLNTILRQSVAVDEIIICDDGSKDGTINIIKQFQTNYPGKIHLFVNETNLGVVKNFEKALRLCTGDVIFFSDQDDEWANDKVEKTLLFFEYNPQYLGAFSDAMLIGENSEILEETFWELLVFKEFARNGMDIANYIALHGNVVTGACLALKKEALPLILPFKKMKLMLHDELTGLALAKLNSLGIINEPLTRYRFHHNQQTNPAAVLKRKHEIETRRNIIKGNAAACPNDYYRYFKKRTDILEEIKARGFELDEAAVALVYKERKKGLIAYLKTMPFIKRKRNLLKLFLDKGEGITLADIFVY